MAQFISPPPTPISLLENVAEWFAKTYRVRVSIEIEDADESHNATFDYRIGKGVSNG